MNTLVQDIRQALRVFTRRPSLAVVTVVSLALGIGLDVDPGFNTEHVALANVGYPARAATVDEARIYYRELEERIRALPRVVEAASSRASSSGSSRGPPRSRPAIYRHGRHPP